MTQEILWVIQWAPTFPDLISGLSPPSQNLFL